MPTEAIGQAQTGIADTSGKTAAAKVLGSGKSSTPAAQTATTASGQSSNAAVEAIAKQVQQALSTANTGLKFSVDNSTGKTIVKVVHEQTGEVIRQIPNEDIMAISRNIGKMQGLLLEKKA